MMKTIFIFLLILAALIVGCTSYHMTVPAKSMPDVSLNNRCLRQSATVIFVDGNIQKANRLRLTADSTSWIDPVTQKMITVRTTEITEIRFVNHGIGALEGLGLGLLSGALLGFVIGSSGGDDPEEQFLSLTAEQKAGACAVLLGGTFGLLGLPIGGAVGHKDVYRIFHDTHEPEGKKDPVPGR